MNKNFKEKQRENILIKLVNRYENKIEQEDNAIDELNKKSKYKEDVIRGIKINQAYWLGVIGLNLIFFPIIGYFTSNVIAGLTMWVITSFTIGSTLLLFKCFERRTYKDLKKLNNAIDTKEKENEEYEKDLESLKRHITPAHIEYDINLNNIGEINNEQDNYFVEDTNEEIETKEIEGPTLVKRKR